MLRAALELLAAQTHLDKSRDARLEVRAHTAGAAGGAPDMQPTLVPRAGATVQRLEAVVLTALDPKGDAARAVRRVMSGEVADDDASDRRTVTSRSFGGDDGASMGGASTVLTRPSMTTGANGHGNGAAGGSVGGAELSDADMGDDAAEDLLQYSDDSASRHEGAGSDVDRHEGRRSPALSDGGSAPVTLGNVHSPPQPDVASAQDAADARRPAQLPRVVALLSGASPAGADFSPASASSPQSFVAASDISTSFASTASPDARDKERGGGGVNSSMLVSVSPTTAGARAPHEGVAMRPRRQLRLMEQAPPPAISSTDLGATAACALMNARCVGVTHANSGNETATGTC